MNIENAQLQLRINVLQNYAKTFSKPMIVLVLKNKLKTRKFFRLNAIEREGIQRILNP